MSDVTREQAMRYAIVPDGSSSLSPEERAYLHSINNQISVISLTASLMRQASVDQGALTRTHIERIAHAADQLRILIREHFGTGSGRPPG